MHYCTYNNALMVLCLTVSVIYWYERKLSTSKLRHHLRHHVDETLKKIKLFAIVYLLQLKRNVYACINKRYSETVFVVVVESCKKSQRTVPRVVVGGAISRDAAWVRCQRSVPPNKTQSEREPGQKPEAARPPSRLSPYPASCKR